MEEKKHFIYVILTQNNKLYCSYTNDVKARYKKHVEGKGAKFTRANKPKALVFQKEFQTKHDALCEEIRFKKLTRKQKEDYITVNADSIPAKKSIG